MVEAAGDRGLAGQAHRLGGGDVDRDQVVGPGIVVGKDLAFLRHQKVDQGRRRIMFVKIDQSGVVDDVILERAAQGHQEHQPALAADGIETGEAVVADL
jgi:hypothetical protein